MSNSKRVNITLPVDLIKQLDIAADAVHLNRSAYIAVAITTKIQQDEMMKQLPYIVHKLQEADAEKERS